MNRNKWQKTSVTWDEMAEWVTNIPVTDLDGCRPHYVRKMQAVSIPNGSEEDERVAILTFEVIRGLIGPTTERGKIIETLQTLTNQSKERRVRVSTRDPGSEFKITFCLRRSFCDEVLDFMEDFFTVLGIKDNGKYRLSNFVIRTETMHRQGEGWIPFTEYFKLQRGFCIRELPVEIMPTAAPLVW